MAVLNSVMYIVHVYIYCWNGYRRCSFSITCINCRVFAVSTDSELTFIVEAGDPLPVSSQQRSHSVHPHSPVPAQSVGLHVHLPPPAQRRLHTATATASGGGQDWEVVSEWGGGLAVFGPVRAMKARELHIVFPLAQSEPDACDSVFVHKAT